MGLFSSPFRPGGGGEGLGERGGIQRTKNQQLPMSNKNILAMKPKINLPILLVL